MGGSKLRGGTYMRGDLQRCCLLGLLLALEVHHQRRIHRGLDLVVDADHTSLAVDGSEAIEVGGPLARLQQVREHEAVVPYKERVWQVSQFLRVLPGVVQRRCDAVRYDVVHVGGTTSPRVTKPHHLHGSRSEGENLIPCPLCIAVHVNEDVNAVCVDAIGCKSIVGHLRQTGKAVEGCEILPVLLI